MCNTTADCATIITALGTLLTVVTAAIAALLSWRSVKEQASLRRAEMQPVMGITDITPSIDPRLGRVHKNYPVSVHFTNLGKGPARVLVIETNRPDLEAKIGQPISVGSDSSTTITLYFGTDDESVLLSLYYWDVDNVCYRTEASLRVRSFSDIETSPEGEVLSEEPFVNYRLDADRSVIIRGKNPPLKVLNWPRESTFHTPWW
jgi:hypothetical protein